MCGLIPFRRRTEIAPFLDATSHVAHAKNWLLTMQKPPQKMFDPEISEALEHLHAAAGLLAAIKRQHFQGKGMPRVSKDPRPR